MNCRRSSRRKFLGRAAGAASAVCLVPAAVLGKDGHVAASQRITLGSIGVGGQGNGLLRATLPHKTAQFVAVCDPYENRRKAARQQVEGHYAGRTARGSYKGCAAYNDFRQLTDRDDVDAVIVASPGHWHGIHSLAALSSGKDVYCEKPLTRTIAEGRAVCRAVRRHGRVFQTGTQQRSDGRFRFACELALGGYLGKVHTAEVGVPGGTQHPAEAEIPVPAGLDYEMWVGPAPMIPYTEHRCANTYGWMQNYNFVVGYVSGWGVHHLDIALWGIGERHAGQIVARGSGRLPEPGFNDTWQTWQVEFTYPDGLKISFTNNDNPHRMGCRFVGDEGWVYVNRQGIQAKPESLLKVELRQSDARLTGSSNHQANFLESINSRRDPISPVEAGHAATTLCNLADITLRLNRKVVYDLAKQSFVDDPMANRMRSRAIRSPWSM